MRPRSAAAPSGVRGAQQYPQTAPPHSRNAACRHSSCDVLVEIGPPAVTGEDDRHRVRACGRRHRDFCQRQVANLGSCRDFCAARSVCRDGLIRLEVLSFPVARDREPVSDFRQRKKSGSLNSRDEGTSVNRARTSLISPCNTIHGVRIWRLGARSKPGPFARRVKVKPFCWHGERRMSRSGQKPRLMAPAKVSGGAAASAA